MKEFDIHSAAIISILDALFGGSIGGCLGVMIKNIFASVAIGVAASVIMLMLDYKYSYIDIHYD